MSGDLISLRMLLVTATPSEQNLWRQGIALASVPIEFSSADAVGAGRTLAKGGVDICVIDSRLPGDDKDAVLNAARVSEPPPFVALSAQGAVAKLEGYDGTLTRPTSPEDARKLIELCVRVKVPTRVLIVDDSSTIRSIVRKILSASRFSLDVHEAEEGGYWAEVPAIPGCATQGETFEELLKNLSEAVEGCLSVTTEPVIS